ncbi:MAG: hypothetical protein JWM59_2239 [Verrucomicrobiales bacterium]|nr:hypothetical protein [Verrucomicrobiales bacterium]
MLFDKSFNPMPAYRIPSRCQFGTSILPALLSVRYSGEMDKRGPPAPRRLRSGKTPRAHQGIRLRRHSCQKGMDTRAQGARSLAMNHPDHRNALRLAFPEPGPQQFRQVTRAEGVQVQIARDPHGHRFGFGPGLGRLLPLLRGVHATRLGTTCAVSTPVSRWSSP